MEGLKDRTIRGGFAKICGQGVNFALRIGSLMVLGRLLDPRDFGLVGMVTAVIGVLNLFRDFGLSTAAVQRSTVTEEQLSTLFWINILVGAALGLVSVAMAPAVSLFYEEPRLLPVTAVLALGFLFNAAGVQHSAILQREMRFLASAVIETVSLLVSTIVGITMAFSGYGYWALVAMTVVAPLVSTICFWGSTAWMPGKPRRNVGIRPMMRFGGTVTLNTLVVYVAYNLDKVLLGRFWGASTIGIYGRAYQLVNIPTENLNSAIGGVAFSALSRVQDDPVRFRSYFLRGYSFVLAITLPVTFVCTLFADELILVILGPKWVEAAHIFRLLAPTILVFALINPLGWLLYALGLVGRSLKVGLVLAPLVILGYVLGLPYGATGVALGYSTVMVLWVVPHVAWCVHGTVVSLKDIWTALSRPLLSGIVAVLLPLALQFVWRGLLPPLPRLIAGGALFTAGYLGMLLYVMGEKAFYLGLLQGLSKRTPLEEKAVVSV
jgi:O-antigen/teichoic acid export membrane protein